MITREQIDEHCSSNGVLSKLLWAKLGRDYKSRYLDYILPAGTIVQVELWLYGASLFLNDTFVDTEFPYDAATLLEE